MSLVWNLPFAVLVVAAAWIRLGKGQLVVSMLAPITRFFGCEADSCRRAACDWLGGTGVLGLLFVAWSPAMAVDSAGWLAFDAVITAVGGGLIYAWLMDVLAERRSAEHERRELAMMPIEHLPVRQETGSAPIFDSSRSGTEM